MSDNWKRTTRQKIIELQQGGESYREMAVRLSVQLRQVIPHHLLYDIARGKSTPTRQLARALGVVTERDGDRVRFAVWMTREKRRELQAAIDRSGMTRAEWLERE